MANLLGEALLATTGFTAALEPGPLVVKPRHLRDAVRLLGEDPRRAKSPIRTRLVDFFNAEAFESPRPWPKFDYEKVLELLAPEGDLAARVQENVAGWVDQELADSYGEALGRAWGYLGARLPKKVRFAREGFAPDNVRPSDLVLSRFRRDYDVVDRPMTVLDDLN